MRTLKFTAILAAIVIVYFVSIGQAGEGNYTYFALSHGPDMKFEYLKDTRAIICPRGDEPDKVEGILKLSGDPYAWGALKFREDISSKFDKPVMWVVTEKDGLLLLHFGGNSPLIYLDLTAEDAPKNRFVDEIKALGWDVEGTVVGLTENFNCKGEECLGKLVVEHLRLLRTVEGAGRCDHGIIVSCPGKKGVKKEMSDHAHSAVFP